MTNFKNGSVKISNDIINQLIAETTLRIEGVQRVLGYKNNVLDTVSKDKIDTSIDGKDLSTQVTITVKPDVNILNVTENIQKEIKKQIRTMLGLDVVKINVVVKDIEKDKEKK